MQGAGAERLEQPIPDERQAAAEDHGGGVQQIEHAGDGDAKVLGLEYLVSGPVEHTRERVYLDGLRLYVVALISPKKEFLASAEADRFFDSFELTK